MNGLGQVTWLPLCMGLTAIGGVVSWVAWRRRGAAAGLRLAGWSLLPLVLYLTGLVELVWQIGSAVARWATRLVLSPAVWAGVALAVLAGMLLFTSAMLRRRQPAGAPAVDRPATAKRPVEPSRRPGTKAPTPQSDDDELAEIEEILRRRGIE